MAYGIVWWQFKDPPKQCMKKMMGSFPGQVLLLGNSMQKNQCVLSIRDEGSPEILGFNNKIKENLHFL